MPNPSGTNDPTPTNRRVFDAMPPGEPVNTTQLVDETGLSKSSVYRGLSRLYEDGVIEKQKLGSRTVVWTKPEGAAYDP